MSAFVKRLSAVGLALVTALATAATLAPAPAASVLHRGNDADPETLDAHKTSTVGEAHLLRDLAEGLVIHDMKGRVIAGVAETWTISQDGRTYTFRLRASARWSNGDAVMAEDFVYSMRRMLDPETGAKYAPVLYPIRNAEKFNKGQGARREDLGVRAIDPRTLEITLERPTAYFLELLTHSTALPVHAPSIARHGRDWVKPGNLVSNGAYTLRSFVPNGEIVLVKNPHFHAAASVAIDEVRFYPTPDNAAAARRFQAGELHFTTDFPTDQLKQLKARLGDQVKVAPYLGTTLLVLKTAKKPLDDVRVRRALAMAIDREFLAEDIWSGTMLPAYGLIPPGIPSYPDPVQVPWAKASPIEREDEARKLLGQAGFGPGKPLRLEIRYNMTDNNQRTMVAVANQWKAIGVETRFIHTDAKTHFAHLRDGGDFDVARYGWIADYSDAQNFLFLLESDNRGFNVGGYSSPEFDGLMRRAADELDPGKRAAILRQADAIFASDLPWIPLMFYQTKNLVSSKLEGFESNLRGAWATRFMRLRP